MPKGNSLRKPEGKKNLTLGFRIPAINLSREAKVRLKWMDYYHQHGKKASLTCRYFGISRKTFYKWLKRYNPHFLQSLESQSKKPKKNRTSQKLLEYGVQIKSIREKQPTWSKYKIGAFVRDLGAEISDSSVGYVLKKRGLIDKNISKRRKIQRKRNRLKIRIKDVEIEIKSPGDLIQIDTKEVNIPGEHKRIQFTAIDCFSRKRVLRGYGRKSAYCAELFLKEIIQDFPFAIKTILTDNGSEFMAEFDEACKNKKITHYWTTPDSPNQNAYVESSHRIDQKEFYEVYSISPGIKGLNQALAKWEVEYNQIRPHGSLGFISPDKFLKIHKSQKVLPM